MPTRKDKTNVAPIYREQVFIPANGATLIKQKARPKFNGFPIASGAIDIVSPEFDLLTGVRGIANLPKGFLKTNKLPQGENLYYRQLDPSSKGLERAKQVGVIDTKSSGGANFTTSRGTTLRIGKTFDTPFFAKGSLWYNNVDDMDVIVGKDNPLLDWKMITQHGRVTENAMKAANRRTPFYNGATNQAPTELFELYRRYPGIGYRNVTYGFPTIPITGLNTVAEQMKCGGRRKAQLGLDIREGGIAIPIAPNMYYMNGRSHDNGGIAIGPNNKNGLEVEGGEVVKVGNKDIKVFSSVPLLRGVSPAQLVMGGANPNKVFKAQEEFKDRNRINDDGTTYEMGGEGKSKSKRSRPVTGVLPYGYTIRNLYSVENPYRKGIKGNVAKMYDSRTLGAGVDVVSGHPELYKKAKSGKITKKQADETAVIHLRKDDNAIRSNYADVYGKAASDTLSYGPRFLVAQARYQQGNVRKAWNNIHKAMAKGDAKALKKAVLQVTPKDHAYRRKWIEGFKVYEMGGKIKAKNGGTDRYYSIMEKVAEDNYKQWGFKNVDEALIHALNDNTYNYKGYYDKYPNSTANADTHWTDEFKTVYHPTFSIESKYSGKKSDYNPLGLIGGYWNGDNFIPAEWQRNKKEFGGNMIYTINGNVKNGLMSARPKAKYGKIDRKNKDEKVGPDGLIYKRAADGKWYTDGTKHVTYKPINKSSREDLYYANPVQGLYHDADDDGNFANVSSIVPDEYEIITRKFDKPKRTHVSGYAFEDEEKETKKIGSLTYEKNEAGQWVPSKKQSVTTTRSGGRPESFGMTRTGVNHPSGKYKYHPLTGEKISEMGVTETSEPSVKGTTKVTSKSSSTPRGEGTTSTSSASSRGTTKVESPKPATPTNPNEARYASRVQKGQAQEVTPKPVVEYNEAADKNPDKYRYTRSVGFKAGKSPSSTGGGTQSKDGRWVGQYKTTNVGDWIGLGSNLAGTIASYFMTKNAINKMPDPVKPIMAQASKLKTRYNVEPQLTEIREAEQMNRASVRRNTQSSNTSLAREQRLTNEARGARNTLYGQKENIETQLINQDRLNRQSVMKDNVRTYNEYLNRLTATKMAQNEMRASNINNLISGLTGNVNSILGNIESRRATNNTLRAIAAANPNADARLIGGFDYYIDPITKKKYNKNQQYVGIING